MPTPGNRIIRLDPFGIGVEDSDALNPLDFIASAPDWDGCRDVARSLVRRRDTECSYWCDQAEQVVTAFVAFVAACEEDPASRNLLTVRALVASRELYAAAVERMQGTENFAVKRQGNSLAWLTGRELDSVLSVVQRHTAWLDSPAVAACLRRSTFAPEDLRGRATLQLILPPERLALLGRIVSPLMRLWLATPLRPIPSS